MRSLLVIIGIIFLGVMMFKEITKKNQETQFATEQYREHWILAAKDLSVIKNNTQRIISNYPIVEFSSGVSLISLRKTALQPVSRLG